MKYCLLLALTFTIAQATTNGISQGSPQILTETGTRSIPQTTHSQQLSTPPQSYVGRSTSGQQFPQYPSSQGAGYTSGRSEYPESYNQGNGGTYYNGDLRDQRDGQYLPRESRENVRGEPQYSVRSVDNVRDVREPQYSVRPVETARDVREPQYSVRPVENVRDPQYSARSVENVREPQYSARPENRQYGSSYNQQYRPQGGLQYGSGRGQISFTAPLANTRSFTQFEPIAGY